jgi:hypothetical protein
MHMPLFEHTAPYAYCFSQIDALPLRKLNMIFSTPRPLQFDDVFSTGKYAGEKVCQVMAKDIGYLWYLEKQGILFGHNVEKCLRGIKIDNHKWIKSKKK